MNIPVSSKEDLINDCKKIVKTQGISGVSIRSLAKEAGISTGAVYNYFPSKNQLLAETIGSIWAEIFHFSNKNLTFTSFTACLEALFESIEEGKKMYPHFFTEHALVMSLENEQMGKKLMANYWDHIKESMLVTLQNDSAIRKGVFGEELTPEEFVEYCFELFLSVMVSEKRSESLLKFVENALY
ncbi:TetR/AcrR family transcriptional regulator [Enterococcus asini]|uniref:TetR/AcrR family transcriptional regulator n=1 Tax=Enterococcus asini TaxID=57732 RepID=UPI0028915537|nr:TetR/AcrR family transcriptional regulator [Enterococcus asini]MDT2757398.1 TetR/AcrR family transcriptional regulator [Enterococcus asini]